MHDRAAGDSLDTCRPQVGRLKPARHRPICELSFLTAPFAMSSVSLSPPPAARAPVSQAATAYVQALRLEVGQWLPQALNDAVALLHESRTLWPHLLLPWARRLHELPVHRHAKWAR